MALTIPGLDYDLERRRIVEFIRGAVEESGSTGVVLGLSGGVDSSVAAALCAEALGSERVLGLVMPTGFTPREDLEDAYWLAGRYGLRVRRIDVDPIVEGILRSMDVGSDAPRIALGNLRARIRMVLNYYFANAEGRLVVGTGDLSEYLLGYYTKHGDGAADLYPIIHLFKSEVRLLGRSLGLPEKLTGKPSSPQLWPGHRARDELPADYEVMDPILYGLFILGLKPERVAEEADAPPSLVEEIYDRHRRTQHKRSLGLRLERV
ncbi:MAG: NAD+ synthase [Candidatus Bathyarchaeia archaeon]|nr:NAD+ synthase [Candidatus Bathyarchaeota archaeon]